MFSLKFSIIFTFALFALVYSDNDDGLAICTDDSDVLEIDGGKKYYLSKAGTETYWLQAAVACHKSGLKFATMDTQEEQDLLIKLVTNATQTLFINPAKNTERVVWIGGAKKLNGAISDYVWLETGQSVSYPLNFKEMKEEMGNTQCLALYREADTSAFKWNVKNYECSHDSNKFVYLCQK